MKLAFPTTHGFRWRFGCITAIVLTDDDEIADMLINNPDGLCVITRYMYATPRMRVDDLGVYADCGGS